MDNFIKDLYLVLNSQDEEDDFFGREIIFSDKISCCWHLGIICMSKKSCSFLKKNYLSVRAKMTIFLRGKKCIFDVKCLFDAKVQAV